MWKLTGCVFKSMRFPIADPSHRNGSAKCYAGIQLLKFPVAILIASEYRDLDRITSLERVEQWLILYRHLWNWRMSEFKSVRFAVEEGSDTVSNHG